MSETWTGVDVIDTDHHFIVNGFTREITSKNPQKDILIKNDHNSERFTFEIPRYIEGRDVGKCNVVQVCYTNGRFSGVYTVDDVKVYPFVNDVITCSWLISQNVTRNSGKLSFMLRFAQVNDDATVEYAWSTKTYDNVRVLETIDAIEKFEDEYVDAIEQWKNKLEAEMKLYVDKTVDTNVDVAQISENAQHISELKTDMAVQKSRMDTLTALEQGSTTGDAELADIRVDVNGATHKTAGDAVREQIMEVRNYSAYGSVFLNNDPSYEYVGGVSVTLTLNGRTEVFYNGKTYTLYDATTTHILSDSSVLFVILFNYETNTIHIQHFSASLPVNCVIIGTAYTESLNLNIYGVGKNYCTLIDSYDSCEASVWVDNLPTMSFEANSGDSNTGTLTLNIPYTVINTGHRRVGISAQSISRENSAGGIYNILYNCLTKDLCMDPRGSGIREGYHRIGIVSTTYGVYLNDIAAFSKTYDLPVAPLILGWSNKFVEIDSVNKTVTFPDDTLIMTNKMTGSSRFFQLTNAKDNTSVSYGTLGTSAILIMYDTLDSQLKAAPYNVHVLDTQILIATIRTSCHQVSINAPYKWDGKPFDMDIEDFGGILVTSTDYKSNFMVESINHRGYCKAAPENTLSAYRLSAQKGFAYVECDVSFTSDNVAVLLHDTTIDRTSSGVGSIEEMTFAEARSYDYGRWFSEEYAGEQIPTFEEFIILCKRLGLHPYIEIKETSALTEEKVKSLVDIVKRNGMRGNVSYISFGTFPLTVVKNYDPYARLGYVVGDITSNVIAKAEALRTDTNEIFIDADYTLVTEDGVNLCVAADLPLEVWTVNDAAWITDSMPQYISGVSSDNIHAGRTLYEKYK